MHSRALRSKFMPCNKCKHFCKVHAPFSINYTVYASDQRVTMCSISTLFFIFMWRRNVHSSCNLKHSLICSTWFIVWHSSLTLPQLQLHYHRRPKQQQQQKLFNFFVVVPLSLFVLLLLLPFRRIPTSMEMGIVKNVNDHNRITSIYIFAPRIACHAMVQIFVRFFSFHCSCRNKNVFLVIITNIFCVAIKKYLTTSSNDDAFTLLLSYIWLIFMLLFSGSFFFFQVNFSYWVLVSPESFFVVSSFSLKCDIHAVGNVIVSNVVNFSSKTSLCGSYTLFGPIEIALTIHNDGHYFVE